jgi:DNA-binding GntR family transcriptional regulator
MSLYNIQPTRRYHRLFHGKAMPRALSHQLVNDVQQFIAGRGLAVGARLPERLLAEQLRVSRSPIRAALQAMEERQLLAKHPDGGFMVAAGALAPVISPRNEEPSGEETAYLQIAGDRIDGALPDKVTENELLRRYGLTRNQLTAVLRRMVHEGWIERLPGHGWAFLPTLTSTEAYGQSYRFRLLMEPAGMLEPTYRLDGIGLRRCYQEQEQLASGAVHTVSPAVIFDANTHLHEVIANSSGNLFIADSLRRLNRVRRLMEYRKAVDRQQAERRCKEHLSLIGLLLEDQREAAADFMRLHLRNALKEKHG